MTEQIKLIAITQGAGELVDKNAQDVISYIARVSNPNNQLNFDTPQVFCVIVLNTNIGVSLNRPI